MMKITKKTTVEVERTIRERYELVGANGGACCPRCAFEMGGDLCFDTNCDNPDGYYVKIEEV